MVLDSILTAVMPWSKDQWIFESSRESEQPTLTTLGRFVAYGAVTFTFPKISTDTNCGISEVFHSVVPVIYCTQFEALGAKMAEAIKCFKYKTYWICHLLKERGIITSFLSMNMIRTNDQIVPRVAKAFQTISRNNICKNKESVHLCALSWFNAKMLIEWIIPFSCWWYVWIFYQPPHVIPFEVNFEAAPCAGNSRELRLQAMRGHARLAWPGENTVEIATINAMQVQVVKLRDVAWYKAIYDNNSTI